MGERGERNKRLQHFLWPRQDWEGRRVLKEWGRGTAPNLIKKMGFIFLLVCWVGLISFPPQKLVFYSCEIDYSPVKQRERDREVKTSKCCSYPPIIWLSSIKRNKKKQRRQVLTNKHCLHITYESSNRKTLVWWVLMFLSLRFVWFEPCFGNSNMLNSLYNIYKRKE